MRLNMSRWQFLKRLFIGKPIATKHAHDERLSKRFGLAVFASDALSSVAYATEEVILILVLAGAAPFVLMPAQQPAFYALLGIALILGVLLAIVATSYYQTIHVYPEGGGSYSVSRANLGLFAGKIAGSALLIDYILTVAVSVAAGTAALVSVYSQLHSYMVPIAVVAVLVIMYANLRGAKESGAVFAIPSYTFIVCIVSLIIWGAIQGWGKPEFPLDKERLNELSKHAPAWLAAMPLLLFLKAFAASCSALTGVEAISNGVSAFKAPEARNASQTLVAVVFLLGFMFIGVSWCAQHWAILPFEPSDPNYKTVVAQLAASVWGQGHFMFYLTQFATVAILFLAANTAFAGFPRLAGLLARDGLMPRYLMTLGDRLVFNNGIILLAAVAIALIAAFNADTHNLVPLYAVGVFTAFTMSQLGMVAYWHKMRKYDWRIAINAVGAVSTGIVTIVLSVTKFFDGAWVTVFAVGGVMVMFWIVSKHYQQSKGSLALTPEDKVPTRRTVALLLVPRMHKGILDSISYAKSLTQDVRALHVTIDAKAVASFKKEWIAFGSDLPMVILESPYRSLVEPILEYIDATLEEDPDLMVTVIVPQGVPSKWWHTLLHNNAAVWIKRALGRRKRVVVTNVRYFLD